MSRDLALTDVAQQEALARLAQLADALPALLASAGLNKTRRRA